MSKGLNELSMYQRLSFGLLYLGATSLYILGLLAPVLSFKKKFLIFTLENDTWSIASGIYELLTKDHLMVGIIVLTFTIIFPIAKLCIVAAIFFVNFNLPKVRKLTKLLTMSGKWSMLDVFVIAVFVVTAKLSSFADATARWGLYMFALHVILSMILVQVTTDYTTKVE